MTPAEFVAKWSRVQLPERAASQEHFIDLCRMLGQPTPAEHDATGAEYTFEKGVQVSRAASAGSAGVRGFADVWWRGKFGWEYKRRDKHPTLQKAYQQLLQYREHLENPPLLIVSDITRIEIHTNFTNSVKQTHHIELQDIAEPRSLDRLRRVFADPESFRPHQTPEQITREVATQFGKLAAGLRARGHEPHAAAHFLMKCMFCLFAEDVSLLPKGLFKRLLDNLKDDPAQLKASMDDLFAKMRTGGLFGIDRIEHFNGGLFDDQPALELTTGDIGTMILAAAQDWSGVEPAIFGTLFERSLDPAARAQIGAHYTSRDDILLVIEPVIMGPLRRRWAEVQAEVEQQLNRRRRVTTAETRRKADEAIGDVLQGFLHELSEVRVLDPACGSGNFLYVAIQQLLGLEKEVITYASRPEVLGVGLLPRVRPTQLQGIEINPYAAELAQVVIWIGYLQWMRDNGFNAPRNPILEPIRSIENRDAILDLRDPQHPAQAQWPDAHFIVGNPPFLGTKMLRGALGDEYVEALFGTYNKRIPNFSDLCCYWFEKAREAIERQPPARAGLLATQGIRGSENRKVLQRIADTSTIFMAWSDRNWVLDGANVHVSIVGFGHDTTGVKRLDGREVTAIHPNLATGIDTTTARRLAENEAVGFVGDVKAGAFDIDWRVAREMLAQPNPNGQSNLRVLRPWLNGRDVTSRRRPVWIIDFAEMPEAEAAGFERPFEHVRGQVKPARDSVKRKRYRDYWWLHAEPCMKMRVAVEANARFIATPTLTKHRLFGWVEATALPDHQLIVFARADDYFVGTLHCSIHEMWARRMGTQLREVESGFRYTPTTCFETFPLPWPPGREDISHPTYQRIADAARELDEQRQRWLNPPEWIKPIADRIDQQDDFSDVPQEARALIRESALMEAAAADPRLKKRTLTNLYNDRPTWLKIAHEKLDRAVLAAYATTDPSGGWDEAWAEVWKDAGAGGPVPDDATGQQRRLVEEAVLGALLQLNSQRL